MSTPAISYEKVKEHLDALSMHATLDVLDGVLEDGQKQQLTPVEIPSVPILMRQQCPIK